MRNTIGMVAMSMAVAATVCSGIAVWLSLRSSKAELPSVVESRQPVDDLIDQTATFSAQIEALEKQVIELQVSVASLGAEQAKPAQGKQESTSVVENQVKEYFVYLGTGSTTGRDWTDLSGTTASIDLVQYGRVKSVVFEATLSIVSGEVRARLKNLSSGLIFHASEVNNNTSVSQWRQSIPFQLPSGINQYVVQIRSSNGERAQLDGARLKIIVE
ncbi:hypothetical protein KBC79_06360 [Candidatus Woesebacteria bacterium]|nr:hypothetical protein [Candidatus Woesebacteria bacterium]